MTAAPQAAPVDAKTASLLALVAGDPIHAADRARVIEGIREVVADFGYLDPNALRAWLTDARGGSIVYPPVIGATIAALRHKGALVADGWVVTTGSRSGNSGRPARRYRLTH